jgi:hypothetical protein
MSARPDWKPARAICWTDPEASLATNNRARWVAPTYKQHTAVDAEGGVLLDVAVSAGAQHDTKAVEAPLDAIQTTTGVLMGIATMEASYAITRVFAALEARGIEAIMPTKVERPPRKGILPVRRFKSDAKHGVVRCVTGTILRAHGKPGSRGFQASDARIADCEPCRPRAICFGATMRRRAILLHKDHPALLRARRKHARWRQRERAFYRRHLGLVEGVHGVTKTWHGLARATRRGLANTQSQAFLTAAVINLNRLATPSFSQSSPLSPPAPPRSHPPLVTYRLTANPPQNLSVSAVLQQARYERSLIWCRPPPASSAKSIRRRAGRAAADQANRYRRCHNFRLRSTDFSQVVCEPERVPTARGLAFNLDTCVTY